MNFTCNQAFQEAHNIFLWRDSNLIQIIEYPTKVLAWKMAQYFSINLKGRGWLNTPVTFSPLESSTETTCKKNLQAKTQEQIKTWWNYCQVTNSGKTIFLKNKPNWRTNNGIWNKLIKINNNNLDPPYCFFVDGWRIFFQIWKSSTALKLSRYGVFLVRIFLYSEWIRRDTPYSVRMREIRTRENSPYLDIFHAVFTDATTFSCGCQLHQPSNSFFVDKRLTLNMLHHVKKKAFSLLPSKWHHCHFV